MAIDVILVNGFVDVDPYGGDPIPIKWAVIEKVGSGDYTVVNAVAGKKIRVLYLFYVNSLGASVSFKSGNNTKVDAMLTIAGQPNAPDPGPHGWVVETNVGEAFIINNNGLGTTRGFALYIEL